jgi:two-component system response regulator YesN
MNNPNDQTESTNSRDFWDSLHLDILTSNQRITHEDYTSFIERSFLYSLFFRDCHPLELNALRKILKIKEHGYVLTLNLPELPQAGAIEEEIDVLEFYQYLHNQLIDKNICIGPQIINRVVLLVTEDSPLSIDDHREKSYSLSNDIITCIKDHFQINLTIGIGSPQPITTIYSSFIDSFSALYYRSSEPIIYYQDIIQTESNVRFDYLLAEKHLIEAIRLRKSEAYDYFSLIMDQIRSYSDTSRRNKILEILVLASHAMSLDKQNEFTSVDYTDIAGELMKTSGFADRNRI